MQQEQGVTCHWVTGGIHSTAMIRIRVGDQEEISSAEGAGPVHALGMAQLKTLERPPHQGHQAD